MVLYKILRKTMSNESFAGRLNCKEFIKICQFNNFMAWSLRVWSLNQTQSTPGIPNYTLKCLETYLKHFPLRKKC